MEDITVKHGGLYTVAEAAALLHTNVHRIYDLIKEAILHAP